MNRRPLIPLLLLTALLAGCGRKNFHNVNDDLRAQRQQLQQRVAELEAELQLRLGEIEALNRKRGPEGALAGELAEGGTLAGAGVPGVPVLSGVKLDRYTGPVDTDGDGRDDLLRLYVRTLDQQGRMLPVAAQAVVQLVHLAPGTPPALHAERTWDPAQFDAAYRTGLTGTHYTLELPLDAGTPDELTVKLTVTAAGGASQSVQQAFALSR